MKAPKLIGITGGIAAGKSTLARWLRDAGYPVVSLDEVGRTFTDTDPTVRAALLHIFGPSIIKEGRVDRADLRRQIVASSEKRTAFEDVLHPKVWTYFLQQAKGKEVCFCESAILIEKGLDHKLDAIILVTASKEIRRQRLLLDGLDERASLIAIQGDEANLKKHAHYIVQNEGAPEELQSQTKKLIEDLKRNDFSKPR